MTSVETRNKLPIKTDTTTKPASNNSNITPSKQTTSSTKKVDDFTPSSPTSAIASINNAQCKAIEPKYMANFVNNGRSAGSGFVVHKSGNKYLIMTNLHVSSKLGEAKVMIGGKEYPIKKTHKIHDTTDIAFAEIETTDPLSVAKINNKDLPKGTPIVGIGYPSDNEINKKIVPNKVGNSVTACATSGGIGTDTTAIENAKLYRENPELYPPDTFKPVSGYNTIINTQSLMTEDGKVYDNGLIHKGIQNGMSGGAVIDPTNPNEVVGMLGRLAGFEDNGKDMFISGKVLENYLESIKIRTR